MSQKMCISNIIFLHVCVSSEANVRHRCLSRMFVTCKDHWLTPLPWHLITEEQVTYHHYLLSSPAHPNIPPHVWRTYDEQMYLSNKNRIISKVVTNISWALNQLSYSSCHIMIIDYPLYLDMWLRKDKLHITIIS